MKSEVVFEVIVIYQDKYSEAAYCIDRLHHHQLNNVIN